MLDNVISVQDPNMDVLWGGAGGNGSFTVIPLWISEPCLDENRRGNL